MYPTPNQLRAARALLGFNQEEAARACGVSGRTLLSVENGKGSLTTLHTVMGAYLGLGVVFDASQDYGRQSVSVQHRVPPGPPPIPED
ncbi:helix-turn-helix transcriptional regulator [Methylorubrum sp. DB1722]|uniref:helix-turn-helix transcriptional regulator n=1 Tax=Methylorubrum sp. DB1722 TaxID=2478916 RepID=UPI0018E2CBC3|nr:helix-turn-helix domain-containing protein [Methylorubrum sp. DB1722]MBI1689503.1 helix-turn-helix domain-containing protein [Methylorubrum sp. DB1722]